MDPRNFLNEVRMFQFEYLSYDTNVNTKEGVEKILYGTEFYQSKVTYTNSSGNKITMNENYSDLIWDAAIYSGVSPYHLASRIKQEVGPFKTHSSISGTVAGFEGLLNFYNIGATSSTESMGAIKNGLQYAKDGKGASEETKANYFIPWNTPNRAITGGAVFIGSSYINQGQYNLYLQKFDVNDEKKSDLFWHQYMTNCLAPYSESSGIYKAYSSNGMLNYSIGFVIPVYNNMPDNLCTRPDILESDYTQDNTKVHANVSNNLNIRTGPSTSYETLTTVDSNQVMTRIAKGKQSGERWDKVRLENGIVGYAFQSYLVEVPDTKITDISLSIDNAVLNIGEEKDINITVTPQEAINEKVIWETSNSNIVSVDNGKIKAIKKGKAIITAYSANREISDSIEITVYSPVTDLLLSKEKVSIFEGKSYHLQANCIPEDATNTKITWQSKDNAIATVNADGLITGKGQGSTEIVVSAENGNIQKTCKVTVTALSDDVILEFDETLSIEGNEITGINIEKGTVKEIRDLINTNLDLEFYNAKGELLNDDDNIGTGCKILLKDAEDLIYSFTFLVYGDVNGDGWINALDVLVIQRHVIEIQTLENEFLKAGNIDKTGNIPSALDVLKIQRHILEIEPIKQ